MVVKPCIDPTNWRLIIIIEYLMCCGCVGVREGNKCQRLYLTYDYMTHRTDYTDDSAVPLNNIMVCFIKLL